MLRISGDRGEATGELSWKMRVEQQHFCLTEMQDMLLPLSGGPIPGIFATSLHGYMYING